MQVNRKYYQLNQQDIYQQSLIHSEMSHALILNQDYLQGPRMINLYRNEDHILYEMEAF